MNKILLCFAAMAVAAIDGRLTVLNRQANSGVHSISDMSNIAFGDGGSSLRPTTEQTIPTGKGVTRYRLTQVYRGLDVLGSVAEAEVRANGEPSGQVYGLVATDIDSDIPDINACMEDIEEMVKIAISHEGFDPEDSRIEEKDGKRYIYIDPDTEKASLIYRVQFFFAEGNVVMFPAYYIEACNKHVMFSFNQIQNATIIGESDRYLLEKRQAEEEDECETDAPTQGTTQGPVGCNPSVPGVGGNPKRGQIVYNQGGKCLDVVQDGDTCTMTNAFARVVDNEGSTTRTKNTPISFPCSEGFSDPVNEAFGVANDAMYFGDITGRLYVEKYGIQALPYAPNLVVHYDSCYDNAFWNGVNMFFGDGCNYFYPLVSQDVITHELGHGITSRNSDLEYRGESGGINEAFSDISGEVSEVFNFGENDWRVGYYIFKGNRALRYLYDPPQDGSSIKHVDNYYNGIDVHYSSGLFNHAFYHMIETEEMDIYDAYQCFLTANLGIWGATTGFNAGGCGVMQACYDHGLDHNKVLRSFQVVGIDLTSCQFDALTTLVDTDETRMNIPVSSSRNPIFKIDVGADGKSHIMARAVTGAEVLIEGCSDSACSEVTASGTASLDVTGEGNFHFVKLSVDSSEILEVRLTNSEYIAH